jgi:hypothetical protein
MNMTPAMQYKVMGLTLDSTTNKALTAEQMNSGHN